MFARLRAARNWRNAVAVHAENGEIVAPQAQHGWGAIAGRLAALASAGRQREAANRAIMPPIRRVRLTVHTSASRRTRPSAARALWASGCTASR
jgi:hypothetical protein